MSLTLILSIGSVALAEDPPLVPSGEAPVEGRVVAESGARTTGPAENTPQPVTFDTLWLSIVGGVSLLLVVWIVRTESSWGGDGR